VFGLFDHRTLETSALFPTSANQACQPADMDFEKKSAVKSLVTLKLDLIMADWSDLPFPGSPHPTHLVLMLSASSHLLWMAVNVAALHLSVDLLQYL